MEQLLRACDAEVREIGMRRPSNLCTKGAAQVELVEVAVVCEMLERDRVGESLAEVLECASDGTRVVRMRVADDRKPPTASTTATSSERRSTPAHTASMRRWNGAEDPAAHMTSLDSEKR